MNHNLTAESLPELGSIKTMLDDLLPAAGGARERPRGANVSVGPNVARAHGAPAVLGAFSLSQFLRGVNWGNRPGFQSPFHRPAPAEANVVGERRVLGALPLREFLAAVNWRNVASPPALELHAPAQPDHARLVIETFMNEIDWD